MGASSGFRSRRVAQLLFQGNAVCRISSRSSPHRSHPSFRCRCYLVRIPIGPLGGHGNRREFRRLHHRADRQCDERPRMSLDDDRTQRRTPRSCPSSFTLAERPERSCWELHRILNEKVLAAQKAGLNVLYCIGETPMKSDIRTSLLQNQIEAGLAGTDRSLVTLAYEPVLGDRTGKDPAPPLKRSLPSQKRSNRSRIWSSSMAAA